MKGVELGSSDDLCELLHVHRLDIDDVFTILSEAVADRKESGLTEATVADVQVP